MPWGDSRCRAVAKAWPGWTDLLEEQRCAFLG